MTYSCGSSTPKLFGTPLSDVRHHSVRHIAFTAVLKNEMHLFVDANSTYRRERWDRIPNDRYSSSNEIVALKSVLKELKRFVSRVVSLPLIKRNLLKRRQDS